MLEPIKRNYKKARVVVDIIKSGVHIISLEDDRDMDQFQEDYHNLSAEEVFMYNKGVTLEDGGIYDIEYYWVKENVNWQYPNEIEYIAYISSAKKVDI